MKNLNPAPVLLLCCALVLAACSNQPSRPPWIDQPSVDFPEASHLTAVGSADDQQTSADRAIANLAKIFEVAVQEASKDFSRAFVVADEAGRRVENEQAVSRHISVQVDKLLRGSKVVEHWQSESGRHYSLAVLDKAPAAAAFRKRIHGADREINNLLRYATVDATNPLLALRALNQAAQLQRQRDEDERSLMIVSNGQGMNSEHDAAGIAQLIREGLASLSVQIEAPDEMIRGELQQALARLGVHTVEHSNLLLQGTLDLAPINVKQGWHWQRGSYQLVFKDADNVLAKQRYPLKVSAQESHMVALRLKDTLNRSLAQHVYQMLSATED
jgi:hypothetical protein